MSRAARSCFSRPHLHSQRAELTAAQQQHAAELATARAQVDAAREALTHERTQRAAAEAALRAGPTTGKQS